MRKVMMYYSYDNKIGGPLTYINTIINSKLKEKYEFSTCFQNKAPGGIDIKLLKQMVAKIKKEKPDIVHIHGAQSEGFYGIIASKLAGCKNTVMTIHGFSHDDKGCKGIKRFLYKNIIEPITIRLSGIVYCVCEATAQRDIIKKNTDKRNWGFIHNCAPMIKVTQDRKVVRSELKFKDEDVVFAICGRLTKDKGFPILEKIIKIIDARNVKNCKFLIVGDGNYTEEFKNNLKSQISSNRAIMIGQTDKVFDYLNASDAFVFPSLHENLSIALLEACACGLPCVVSNVGGNGEIISDGVNGYLIDGFEPEEYVEAIEKLTVDAKLRCNMGKKALETIKAKFTLEKMCDEIDEVYKHVSSREGAKN